MTPKELELHMPHVTRHTPHATRTHDNGAGLSLSAPSAFSRHGGADGGDRRGGSCSEAHALTAADVTFQSETRFITQL